jgi:hypothetical protein
MAEIQNYSTFYRHFERIYQLTQRFSVLAVLERLPSALL